MADNYLEKRYDEYLQRKAAAEKAKRAAWKKRLDAYRRKLAAEQESKSGTSTPQPTQPQPTATTGHSAPYIQTGKTCNPDTSIPQETPRR